MPLAGASFIGARHSAAIPLVGHRTQWVYQRYDIVDEAMFGEGALKLAAIHAVEKNGGRNIVTLKSRKTDIAEGNS